MSANNLKELNVWQLNQKKAQLIKDISKYKNLQMAKKVGLNSLYGSLGNQYFRYFDLDNAIAITTAGQLAIRWIENKLNVYINDILKTTKVDYVIASDTDSIYLNLGPIVNKHFPKTDDPKKTIEMMNRFCLEKIQPFIDASYDELCDYVNAYAQKMDMKREALCDSGIWTAKKRYILNVYDNEGVVYSKPKLKIMGLEAIKSSTPTVCRQKIKEAFSIILEGDVNDLLTFIEEFREEFKKCSPEDIAFPRSANELNSYSDSTTIYGKGTPIHVRGSLIYNDQLVKNNLTMRYESIRNGDKIKYLHLKMPNPTHSSVISFPNVLPKELDLQAYIDYDTQYQKSFLDPLTIVTNSIGWNLENINTLESLFG